MFNTLSSYFSRIKRHFFRAVEDAKKPCKRPYEELSDDEDFAIKTSYAPVRKKICHTRDEPFLPMTRTLHFAPTLRCVPQKRSPLRPIPEDEPPQSRVKADISEIKITGFRNPSSNQASTLFPWTPIWPQDQDAAPSTSRRIIPPRLKTYSKQKLDGGRNDKKELQFHRNLSARGMSEFQPRQCLSITNHRQVRSAKPENLPSKRWKSFTMEESFRIEEKKQYQQLLERCTSNLPLPFSASVGHTSSSSSTSSSPLPVPVYELRRPKNSLSIPAETENENIIPTSSSGRLQRSAESKVSTCRRQDCPQDQKRYPDHYKDRATKTSQSKADTIQNSSNSTRKRVKSVIKNGKHLDENENASMLQLVRLREVRGNDPVPLIDIADSDSDSVKSHKTSSSDTDGVEIVNEFPHGRTKAEFIKNLVERERMKHMQDICGRVAQATDAKDSDAENEIERRRRISQDFYSRVEDRMKRLDIISTSPGKRGTQAARVKPYFVPLTPKMQAAVDAALVHSPKSQVLIHKFNIKITRRDIQTLKGLNWLNDEIVNFYMNLIMDRSKNNHRLPSVYAVNTFFYPKLKNSGPESVSRWTKTVDIFTYDVLLVPIHLGVHWCMATVDFKNKCISYYDSMLGNNDQCLQLLLNYLEAEHLDKKKTQYRTATWKLENVKDIPEQMNGSDCGVFSCQFADYKARQAKMDFTQRDMPYFRRKMVYEIINALMLE